MIVTQSPIELSTRGSPMSSEVVLELPCIEEEDDIHICGTCKSQFNDIFLFMRHKSEGTCTSNSGKNLVSVTVSPSVPTDCTPIFSSAATSEGKLNSVPGTVYTRVAIVSNDSLHTQKQSPPKGDIPPSLPETLHLSVSSLSAESSNLILSGLDGKTLNLRKNNENVRSSSAVSQLDRCRNQEALWQREILQQHGIHFIEDHEEQSQRIHTTEERVSDHVGPVVESGTVSVSQGTLKHEKGPEDSGHSMTRRCGFLDIEDVEVATLLANHLANEPTLHMYPSASESLLSYTTNMPSQLGLADSSDGMHFVSDIEIEDKCSDCPSEKRPQIPSFSEKSACDLKSFALPTKASQANVVRKQPIGATKKRKLHPCQVEGCGYQGPSVRDLNRHMRKHTGERPFKCPQCAKDFSRRDKLSHHLRIHSGKKSFKCEVCGYASIDHYGLVRHMRIHNDERPYKCQICNYGARTMSHLKVHLRTHTGDHPYVCKVNCGKAFKTSSDLQRHMRMHSGDKPFPCPHCSYRCALKSNLQIHIRLIHSSGESLICSKCDTVCHSRREFRKHQKTHGDNLQRCSQCDYVCVTKSALKNHSKIHLNEQKRSNTSIGSKQAMGCHRSQTRKKSTPKKTKTVRPKINEEPGEYNPKTYNCRYCSASFWREDALEVHVRQHDAPIPSPAPQDPVLADSADSRESTDSNSMDSSDGLTSLATLASYHSIADQISSDHQPAFLYRYISGSQINDNIRNPEVLTLSHAGGGLPQYVAIQGDVDTLNSMQYVLPSPLGSLDDSDNTTNLLC